MKLEKFSASSMTEIMDRIKKKLGTEAFIYSQTKTARGIEVIAGLSTPTPRQATAPQTTDTTEKESFLERLKDLDSPSLLLELQEVEKYNAIFKRLKELKFPYDFCDGFAREFSMSSSLEEVKNHEIVIKGLLSKVSVPDREFIHSNKISVLVGPTGVGKSTTIAKLARRFASMYGTDSIGIISTDFQRIINKNQFKYFGKLLNIQVEYAHTLRQIKEAIHLLNDKELILIDTAGVNQNNNQKLAELFDRLNLEINQITSYLVLPCNVQHEILDDVVSRFRMPHTQGCILTKVDEAKSIAPCLSVTIKHQIPISYCCDGQNIVKNICAPSRAQLINALFQGIKHGF